MSRRRRRESRGSVLWRFAMVPESLPLLTNLECHVQAEEPCSRLLAVAVKPSEARFKRD